MSQYRRQDEGPLEPRSTDGLVPPHDMRAEQATLGACMIETACLDVCSGWLFPEHFYGEAHRRIWEACLALRAENRPVDIVTVGTWLKDAGRIAQVGGLKYLQEVLESGAVLSNVEEYAKTVKGKALIRRTIATCQEYAARGYLEPGDSDQFVADTERALSEVAAGAETEATATGMGDLIRITYDRVHHAAHTGLPPGIATGFAELDRKTVGQHRGELSIVAARPGMGKTAFVLAVAVNVAKHPPQLYADTGEEWLPQGVAIFSLEMPKEQLGPRFLAAEGRVPMNAIKEARLNQTEWTRMTETGRFLAGLPIFVDDTSALHIDKLRARVRRLRTELRRRHVRLTMVIVDYLQLMKGTGPDVRGREQEIGVISRGLKQLSKEENVAVWALSQLNRAVETRTGPKRPTIADLRESGSIEQDADNIHFLYRPEYYGETMAPDDEGKTEIIIGKQRNGPTCTVHARYVPSCIRFENM